MSLLVMNQSDYVIMTCNSVMFPFFSITLVIYVIDLIYSCLYVMHVALN